MNDQLAHHDSQMDTSPALATELLDDTPVALNEMDESNEQIRVLLGQVPHWFLRWGTTAIVCGLLSMTALSWYITYPDVVTADIVITTEHAPITVVSRAQGKLWPILVTDRETVDKGQVLAMVENTARYEDVYALLQAIEHLTSVESLTLPVFSPHPFWRLGEVQESYQAVEKSYQEWQLYQRLVPPVPPFVYTSSAT